VTAIRYEPSTIYYAEPSHVTIYYASTEHCLPTDILLPQCVFMAWCLVKGRGNFTFYCVQSGSGAHAASYPMGTGGSPRGKAVGTWSLPLNSF